MKNVNNILINPLKWLPNDALPDEPFRQNWNWTCSVFGWNFWIKETHSHFYTTYVGKDWDNSKFLGESNNFTDAVKFTHTYIRDLISIYIDTNMGDTIEFL